MEVPRYPYLIFTENQLNHALANGCWNVPGKPSTSSQQCSLCHWLAPSFRQTWKKTLSLADREEFLFYDYVFSTFYLVKNSCNFALSWSLSLPDFSLIRVSLVVESQSLISGCSKFLANPWNRSWNNKLTYCVSQKGVYHPESALKTELKNRLLDSNILFDLYHGR